LQLNGYTIAKPTVLARISHEELEHLFRGYGYTPYFVEGHEAERMPTVSTPSSRSRSFREGRRPGPAPVAWSRPSPSIMVLALEKSPKAGVAGRQREALTCSALRCIYIA
jgi:hypothetical protein